MVLAAAIAVVILGSTGPELPMQYSTNYTATSTTTVASSSSSSTTTTTTSVDSSFRRWDTALQASLELGLSGTSAGMETLIRYPPHPGAAAYTVTAFGICEKSAAVPPLMITADPLGWVARATRVKATRVKATRVKATQQTRVRATRATAAAAASASAPVVVRHHGVLCSEWRLQEPCAFSPRPINKTIWLDAATGVPVGSTLRFPHEGPAGAEATLTVNESWSGWTSGAQPAAALAVPAACK